MVALSIVVFPSAAVIRNFRTTDSTGNSPLNDSHKMPVDRRNGHAEKLSDELLRQPNSLRFKANLKVVPARPSGKNEEVRRGVADWFFVGHSAGSSNEQYQRSG